MAKSTAPKSKIEQGIVAIGTVILTPLIAWKLPYGLNYLPANTPIPISGAADPEVIELVANDEGLCSLNVPAILREDGTQFEFRSDIPAKLSYNQDVWAFFPNINEEYHIDDPIQLEFRDNVPSNRRAVVFCAYEAPGLNLPGTQTPVLDLH